MKRALVWLKNRLVKELTEMPYTTLALFTVASAFGSYGGSRFFWETL